MASVEETTNLRVIAHCALLLVVARNRSSPLMDISTMAAATERSAAELGEDVHSG